MSPQHLHQALTIIGLRPTGPVRFGMANASVSTEAINKSGVGVWVRVAAVPDEEVWMRADAPGEAAAALGAAVPMPRLLERVTWRERDPVTGHERDVRADVFPAIDHAPIAAQPWIRDAPAVTDAWWHQLRHACDTIAATTGAGPGRPERMVVGWVKQVAGERVDTSGLVWTPAHGDLHWANLFATPELLITDWEGYALAPAGLDAALLLAYSLGHPPTAARVRTVFADVFAGESGRLAQVLAAAEVLSAVDNGCHPELEQPLRRHLAHLLVD